MNEAIASLPEWAEWALVFSMSVALVTWRWGKRQFRGRR